MSILSEEEKKEMLKDAKSEQRQKDFRRLAEIKYRGFSLEWLEVITKLILTNYPRHFIKADKNRL